MACNCCEEPICEEPIIESNFQESFHVTTGEGPYGFDPISAHTDGTLTASGYYESASTVCVPTGEYGDVLIGSGSIVNSGRRYLTRVINYAGCSDDMGAGGQATTGSATVTFTVDPDTGDVTFVVAGSLTDGTTTFTTGSVSDHPPTSWDAIVTESVSDLNPYVYDWKICPSASCYYKLWWDEKVSSDTGGAPVLTPKTYEVTPVSVDGLCIPIGVNLSDNSTWPVTADYTSDDRIEVINLRWSCIDGYEPDEWVSEGVRPDPDLNAIPWPIE